MSAHMVRLRLVLETFPDRARGVAAWRAEEQLWRAGLRPPAQYRVPRPFAWDDSRQLLARAFVPGGTWADYVLRSGTASPGVSERVAGWLVALQQNQVLRDSLRLTPADSSRVIDCGTELAAAAGDKDEYRAIEQLTLRIAESLGRPARNAAVPSHGDFHPKNLLIVGPSVVALDLDRLSLREPAADPGRALGQLLSMSLARTGGTAAGISAGMDFWRAYGQIPGGASWDRVALHASATLLECIHYVVCVHQARWPGSPRRWAAQVGHCLRSDGPRVLADLAVTR